MADKKQVIKKAIAGLIELAKNAVLKLIKTKLLPKAEEKYCKVLQATAEKLVDKVDDLVEDVEKEDNVKKKAKALYLLKLCKETMSAVGEMLIEASKQIPETVNLDELETNEEIKVAVAEITGESEGGCGPDGCEIA